MTDTLPKVHPPNHVEDFDYRMGRCDDSKALPHIFVFFTYQVKGDPINGLFDKTGAPGAIPTRDLPLRSQIHEPFVFNSYEKA